MRDVAVAERTFPLLVVDRLLVVGVAIVEFLDAHITELMVAWSDTVYTGFGRG